MNATTMTYGAAGVNPVDRAALPDPARAGLWMMLGLIVLITIEYVGVTKLVPALGAARVPTLMAIVLFCGAMLHRDRAALIGNAQARILMTLASMTILSVAYAVVQMLALASITPILGYIGLFIVTSHVVSDRTRVRQFATVASFIIVLLVLRNVDSLQDTSRTAGYDAGYFMSDGNDFAWGIGAFMPMGLYLLTSSSSLWRRGLGLLAVLANIATVVGTSSRGAALATGAALVCYALFFSKRRILAFGLLAVITVTVVTVAPETFVDRVGTIATYEEDGSAMGRIRAWRSAVQMALDYPLGVGANNFNSAYGRFYMPDDAPRAKWISAHSIYFKTLAEYGFPGLALLISLIIVNLVHNHRSAALCRKFDGPFPDAWPQALSIATIAFAIGGMFLGGLLYPHIFILSGLTAATYRECRRHGSRPAVSSDSGDASTADAAGRAPWRRPMVVAPAYHRQPSTSPVARVGHGVRDPAVVTASPSMIGPRRPANGTLSR